MDSIQNIIPFGRYSGLAELGTVWIARDAFTHLCPADLAIVLGVVQPIDQREPVKYRVVFHNHVIAEWAHPKARKYFRFLRRYRCLVPEDDLFSGFESVDSASTHLYLRNLFNQALNIRKGMPPFADCSTNEDSADCEDFV